jgi:hypothetical protein|tara:strand:- start:723 stop:1040 length:318 start_codon:yes stop_codon:yes gene_type:complete
MNNEYYNDTVFKKYLDCSWKFANNYNNYSNELELYNKIRCDKINEYKNYYITMSYCDYNANKFAYRIINNSITLQNQYKNLENAEKKLKDIDPIYNNFYNKLFID